MPQLSEAARQAPKIATEQEAQRPFEQKDYSHTEKGKNDEAALTSHGNQKERKSNNDTEEGSEKGTEFWPPFFGIRVKVTDSLIALFTFVLAIVTGGLWYATHRLWKGAEEQASDFKSSLELARKQFIATHRPKLKISDIAARPFIAGNPIGIGCAIVNVGDSSAKVMEVSIKLFVLHKSNRIDGAIGIPTDKVNESEVVLVSGQMAGIEYSSPETQNSFLSIDLGDYIVYAYGKISYLDDNGTRRRMGFLRWWDVTSSRFRVVDDPDYEYQD